MSDEDEGDKPHEPTQRKLDKARKRGEVTKSADLTTAAGYGGLTAVLMLGGPALMAALSEPMAIPLGSADRIGGNPPEQHLLPVLTGLVQKLALPAAAIFAVPAAAVLAGILAQRAFVIAPSKLAPKMSRISPISNAKNKFGRGGLFEFAKSTVKMLIYAGCLWLFIQAQLPEILSAAGRDIGAFSDLLGRLSLGFLLIVTGLTATIGALDYFWQRAELLRKNRMSLKELRDEMKESDGDPHFKQARRMRAQEIAMNRMLADVPKADVVVVNPTHYAVALKWDRNAATAPVVVAKGVDEIAARIREIAATRGIPVHADPPTARALHGAVQIGQEIPVDLYRPIAAAIRFADEMRRKRRMGWQG